METFHLRHWKKMELIHIYLESSSINFRDHWLSYGSTGSRLLGVTFARRVQTLNDTATFDGIRTLNSRDLPRCDSVTFCQKVVKNPVRCYHNSASTYFGEVKLWDYESYVFPTIPNIPEENGSKTEPEQKKYWELSKGSSVIVPTTNRLMLVWRRNVRYMAASLEQNSQDGTAQRCQDDR